MKKQIRAELPDDSTDWSSYIEEHHPDIVICVRDETTYLSVDGNGICS